MGLANLIMMYGIMIVMVIAVAFYLHWRGKRKLVRYLRSKWAVPITNGYDYNELQNIKLYWDMKVEAVPEDALEGRIDALTWHDLAMDEVFGEMSHTVSVVGERYLYGMLHTVQFDVTKLQEFDTLVEQLGDTEDIRLKIQMAMDKIGKCGCKGVPSYLYKIDEKENYHRPIYNLLGVLPILSLFVFLVDVKSAIITLCVTMLLNAYIHYQYTNNISFEMHAIGDIYQLLKLAKKLSKLEHSALTAYTTQLKESCKRLKPVLSIEGRFFLSTNSDLGIIQEYLGIITLSQIRMHAKFLGLFKRENEALRQAHDTLGLLEAAIAIGSYRESKVDWAYPEFTQAKRVEVEALYHPLIEDPVANDLTLTHNAIITGSNASGKSTFVKALAINGILAQSVYMVHADKFVAPLSYYMTSMAISDNILTSESYYIAEIRSLKRILDTIEKYPYCTCFIDEILKGTNTIERIAASAAILDYLTTRKCRALVASHDIELTQMLADRYANYHFREQIEDQAITFDYKLHEGPSTTRNAIKLLELMGYEETIIKKANQLANTFMNEQVWEHLDR